MSVSASEFPPAPTPTYRHLLAARPSTNSPLRCIAHCDVDAAYAQFEARRLGLDCQAIPIAVLQWQGLIAVNYKAREFGIGRHCRIDEALKLCPQLRAVHVATLKEGEEEPGYWHDADSRTHKVSLDPYRRESIKIIKLFQNEVPDGEIEKASIDEAYLDLSTPVLAEMRSRYASILEPYPEDLDTPLPPPPSTPSQPLSRDSPTSNIVPTQSELDAREEMGEVENAKLEQSSWGDIALFIGAEIMQRVRAKLIDELTYTTSAGIAHNKVIAKLCSALKKPNAQTVLRHGALPSFLTPFPFRKIRNFGGKMGELLTNEYSATTVADLLPISVSRLQLLLGEEAAQLTHSLLRGIDHAPVEAKEGVKSMLASKNMSPALRVVGDGERWLRVLSVELAGRLKEGREDGSNVWPKTVTLGYRESGLAANAVKHRSTPFPFTTSLSSEYVLKFAMKLWNDIFAGSTLGRTFKINNISLSFTGLEKGEEGQKGIEGYFSGKKKSKDETVVVNEEEERRNRAAKRDKLEKEKADKKKAEEEREARRGIKGFFALASSSNKSSYAKAGPGPKSSATAAASRKSKPSKLQSISTADQPISLLSSSDGEDEVAAKTETSLKKATPIPQSPGKATSSVWTCPDCHLPLGQVNTSAIRDHLNSHRAIVIDDDSDEDGGVSLVVNLDNGNHAQKRKSATSASASPPGHHQKKKTKK